ncbi:reverse transcriptase [Plakobranchus ocellatus]|uniref:Reverse transcriptase n=1 Tax=Plakobranchus ocellatus TaxID=259542 RepID=A0AAV4BYV4_9GAST|nr:reverse transcriptase [Plakobranchus ocellatus]
MEEAHALKEGKYLGLIKELKKDGYEAMVMPVEIGARGFVGLLLTRHFSVLLNALAPPSTSLIQLSCGDLCSLLDFYLKRLAMDARD